MLRVFIFASVLILFSSCQKETEEDQTDSTPFYLRSRTVLYTESFDSGSQQAVFGKSFSAVSIGMAYVQTGPCSKAQKGNLIIGCVPTTDYSASYHIEKQYELGFADTLFDYSAEIPFSNPQSTLGIQIDYLIAGNTTVYFEGLILSNNLSKNDLIGKSLHLFLDANTKFFQAFINEVDVTSSFEIEETSSDIDRIEFVVPNEVLYINGNPWVGYNGMSIDFIEIYTF